MIDYPAIIEKLERLAALEAEVPALVATATEARAAVGGTGHKLTISRLRADEAATAVEDKRAEIATLLATLPPVETTPFSWSCQYLAAKRIARRRLDAELKAAEQAHAAAVVADSKGAWKRTVQRGTSASIEAARAAIVRAMDAIARLDADVAPIQRNLEEVMTIEREDAELEAWRVGKGPKPAAVETAEAAWLAELMEGCDSITIPTGKAVIIV